MVLHNQRLIVITGVTRGLGRALAEGMSQMGHTVLGCGRSHDAIIQLSRDLGRPHEFVQLDVTQETAVRAWAQRVLTEHRARSAREQRRPHQQKRGALGNSGCGIRPCD